MNAFIDSYKQNPPPPPAQYKPAPKHDKGQYVKGVAAGIGVMTATELTGNGVCKLIVKNRKKDDALGVTIPQTDNILNKIAEKFKFKDIPARITDPNSADPLEAAGGKILKKLGGAAFFYDSKKSINQIECIPNQLCDLPHEAGHFINANCSKIGDFYLRHLFKPLAHVKKWGIPVLAGLAIANNKEDENKNAYTKTQGFLERHIGIIAAIPFMPGLIDEGFASIRALKATKAAEPTLYKGFKRNYLLAFATYLAEAGIAVGGAKLAVFVKNKIVSKPKENEKQPTK